MISYLPCFLVVLSKYFAIQCSGGSMLGPGGTAVVSSCPIHRQSYTPAGPVHRQSYTPAGDLPVYGTCRSIDLSQ